MPASVTDPDHAFASGAQVVTPNNRLARWLVDRYDRSQLARGAAAWPSARALPWNAFVTTLWSDALAADALAQPLALLNTAQALRLWERAIETDELPLLNSRGAADLAASAWQTFHAHADPGEPLASLAARGEDAATFVRWATRFESSCQQQGAVDAAALPQLLSAACATNSAWVQGLDIVCVGFVEYTPAQARLLDTLAGAGARVQRLAWPGVPTVPAAAAAATPSRAQFATARDEIAAAFAWAASALREQPGQRIGIAVLDLSSRLAEVQALADDILCPYVYARGRLTAPRPWNVSLGTALADHPVVVTALDVLALAAGPLPLATAAALVRSPFLSGGRVAAGQRAQAEERWRNDNLHHVPMPRLLAALPEGDPLAPRLGQAMATLRAIHAATATEWADTFRDVLLTVGWPGTDVLVSDAFQAREAWQHTLEAFRSLGMVEPRLRRTAALAALRNIATSTVFQPERVGASVQVLGLLEAAGLSFDKLWLAGMSAEAWPPPVQTDPLLPPAWQRAHGYVPADPLRTLARAKLLTAQLAAAAPDVVASHVLADDSPPRVVSPLCDWPLREHVVPALPSALLLRHAPVLDVVDDVQLPALAVGSSTRGGARLVELQSDCPFRAATALRLRVDPWPTPAVGLSPIERGKLLHDAFARFWRVVRDHAALVALHAAEGDALRAEIAAAVTAARSAIDERRWLELPPALVATETGRTTDLLLDWLVTQELPRNPFMVSGIETDARMALGTLDMRFRIDRIDTLGDAMADPGHLAIIDYKSGGTPPVGQWLLPRPVAPQPGLYALATQAANPHLQVEAVVLAQVKAGDLATRGLANPDSAWQGLRTPDEVTQGRFTGLHEVMQFWHARYAQLATDFQQGIAGVAPRAKPLPCTHCDFKPLCRIGSALAVDDAADDDQPAEGAAEA